MITLLTGFACTKSDMQEAIIVRDCTGTYVRINNQDFFVCNKEKIADFKDGEDVKVSVQTLDGCNSNDVVCMMFHESAGFVKVKQVVNR
jgi:hypothetical protein